MFRSLLDKRKQVESEEIETSDEDQPAVEVADVTPDEAIEPVVEVERRKPGRPRGRRSNPDYTQISAYIPLDLLLDIQEELSKEKRRLRKRSAMTVSELAENLLQDWLKQRKNESAKP
ncbi:MAG: hypothetical protein HC895_03305 [Leptolyngbyaceae cyanobacterium SM1_3_5]|nr:hypothetical protein [Leptolyngbyaceae cyanobacterium SM1_3_5]